VVNGAEIRARVDRAQRRHGWLAFPCAVLKKYGEDSSGNLAVLITYYAFFSIFPLLLALSSILGFVLHDHPDLQRKIQQGALDNFRAFPLIHGPPPVQGSVWVVIIGSLLALYSGLGVAKSALNAGDIVYGVPREERPGFVPKTLHSLRLLLVAGLGLIATTVISTTITTSSRLGLDLRWEVTLVGFLVTFVLDATLFAVVFRWITVRDVGFREALPGAVICSFALCFLQTFASVFITFKLKGASATYGSLGTVIVLLSWFYLQAQAFVLSAQVNVVRQYRLWPRSMLDDTGPPPVPKRLPAQEASSPQELRG
jgi:membrane protein